MKRTLPAIPLGLLLMIWLAFGVAAQEETEPAPTPAEVTPEVTDEFGEPIETPVVLDPLLSIGVQPPIDIDLPRDWLFGYDTLAYQDIDGSVQTTLIAVYTGPVTGGTGWLILAWGHNSVMNPFEMESESRAIFLDGLRLLRLIVFDASCTVTVEPQAEYNIGIIRAPGAAFTATECPGEQPDTSGWFASLRQENVNFTFFAYVDPLQEPGSPAEEELQAILNSIVIRVDEVIMTQEEFEATRAAILEQTPGAALTLTAEATAEATEAP